jgi:hypothetical protein
MSHAIAGVLPIVHTPFTNDDQIDVESLERQIEWACSVGTDGFCTGMVSELLRLTSRERLELNRRIAELNAGRKVVVAGVGAESTKQAVEYAQSAADAGCHAVMAIPPISSALPHHQLLDYFAALAQATPLPVIVQDASSYVGQVIPLSVHAELLDQFGPEKILFKPEASPIGPNLSALRDATQGFRRCLPGRQLSPRHRRYDARHGVSARHHRFVEGTAARRRTDDLQAVLSHLRAGGTATASRPRRIPGRREISAPPARPVRYRPAATTLPLGHGRGDAARTGALAGLPGGGPVGFRHRLAGGPDASTWRIDIRFTARVFVLMTRRTCAVWPVPFFCAFPPARKPFAFFQLRAAYAVRLADSPRSGTGPAIPRPRPGGLQGKT